MRRVSANMNIIRIFMAKMVVFLTEKLCDIISKNRGLNCVMQTNIQPFILGNGLWITGKNLDRIRVFPTFHKFFHKQKKNGELFISVDIKTFDKIELFSSFFDMDKMNNRKFWQ